MLSHRVILFRSSFFYFVRLRGIFVVKTGLEAPRRDLGVEVMGDFSFHTKATAGCDRRMGNQNTMIGGGFGEMRGLFVNGFWTSGYSSQLGGSVWG